MNDDIAHQILSELKQFRVRFDGIDSRFDGIDSRFDGIDGRLDGIDGRLDGIDGRFDGIDGRLDGIDGRLDGMEVRLEKLEVGIDYMTGVVEEVRVSTLFCYDRLVDRVNVHRCFDGVYERLDALEKRRNWRR